MRKYLDVTGERYGRLIAIRRIGYRNAASFWLFSCDCGNEKTIDLAPVRSGRTRSCGCLHSESASKIGKISRHGWTGTRTHNIWRDMLKRAKNHPDYAGRGIKVCDRWLVFENFLADMGPAPEGLTIDRIENNGNYEPSKATLTQPRRRL